MASRGRPKKRVDQVQTTVLMERELMLQIKQYCRQESDRLGVQFSISDAIAEFAQAALMYNV